MRKDSRTGPGVRGQGPGGQIPDPWPPTPDPWPPTHDPTCPSTIPPDLAGRWAMERAEVISRVRQTDVQLVRFLYCDNGSVIRGKTSHVDGLDGRLAAGIGLTVAMQAMNSLDQLQAVEGMGPVGEIRLMPDPDTFVVLPYAPRSATMLTDMVKLDGEPWEACPRSFLKRQIARAQGHGLQLKAAFESEWSLALRV